MRKELYVILIILSLIFASIWFISEWNRKHGKRRKTIRLKEQRRACVTFVHLAKMHDLPLTKQECAKNIVGVGYKTWTKMIQCMKTHKKEGLSRLSCVGRELCTLGRAKGCVLEGGALAVSESEKLRREGAVKLLEACKNHRVEACDFALAWYAKQDDRDDLMYNALLRNACSLGRQQACEKIHKDPILEACASEDITSCLGRASGSQDPMVRYLACSYGHGPSCGKMQKLLFPYGVRPALIFEETDACLAGNMDACGDVARKTDSLSLGRFACNGGSMSSCLWLSSGVADPRRRLFLSQKLCRSGFQRGCKNMYDAAQFFLR